MNEIHPRVVASINVGVEWQCRRHAEQTTPIRSPQDFADALGYDAHRIAKTVLLGNSRLSSAQRLTQPFGNYLAACLPAPCRIDFSKLACRAGWPRCELATRDELKAILGYPVGGVSPFGLGDVPLFIDHSLMEFETVLVGAGTVGVEIEITPLQLLQIDKAKQDAIAVLT
jgi:Cys-tRNA(Pro)/Cys-tRNA(Cys) deacylase